ncbi:MAG: class I SAM-dependent methyltransferase [Candidatus Levyibacteriota bacterium]
MNHTDHVMLIKKGITPGGMWADLGSGDGAFTLALRDVAGADIEIYSVDQDGNRLDRQKEAFAFKFPQTNIYYLKQDFTSRLELPQLDGIIMANSLHYVKEQMAYLSGLKKYLKLKARLVLVEYNADQGNQWVPYPISFQRFGKLAKEAGFASPQYLHGVPSQFLNEIYAAVTTVK